MKVHGLLEKVLCISLSLGKHQPLDIPVVYLNIFQDASYRLYHLHPT